MRIVFMGTPDFAVPSLQSLVDAGHEICAVFTQPDKPKGRGYVLTQSPVKELALKYQIDVYQPKTLKSEEAAEQIRNLAPDVIVVIAYGKLLPKAILDIPKYGCINVHGSLLPKYRGAAPIQWSVINGDKVTGVTTMYMAEGIDTGDMIMKAQTDIGPDETSGELHDRLSVMGADLIVKTLQAVKNGSAERIPQTEEGTCYASMLSKELARIDWKKSAQEIHNLVRGLSPWPVAYTSFQGKMLKIYKTRLLPDNGGIPGKALEVNGSFIVCCGDNTALELAEVQLEGKKRMSGSDFLLGHPLSGNKVFE